MTPEEIAKLQEEHANYKNALQEERARRKQASEELEAYKSQTSAELEELKNFKKELEEKEAKKKWKYEELLAKSEEEKASLKQQLDAITGKASKYDEFLNKSLEEKLALIPEEKRDFVSKVLWDKAHEEKLELLDGFVADYSKKDFSSKPKEDWEGTPNTSDYDKALKEWNVSSIIANAPVIKTAE